MVKREKNKILNLENNREETTIITSILEKAELDLEVWVVGSIEEFKQALKSRPPEIIVFDQLTPSLNFAVIWDIFQEYQLEIPYVIVATTVTRDLSREIWSSGVGDYILKDRLELLPDVIKYVWEKARFKKEKHQLSIELEKNKKIIKDSFEKYKTFCHHSSDGVLLAKPGGEILSANPTACLILTMTEEEICKAGWGEITTESSSLFTPENIEQQKTGKVKIEAIMKRKDGSKFPAELFTSVFTNLDGAEFYAIVIKDISHKIPVEEELYYSQENYKYIFEHHPLPNWIFDQNTLDIVDVNNAAIHNYGYTREEFLKLNIKDLRPEEEIPHFKNHFLTQKSIDGIIRSGKFIHKRKDGSLLTVEIFGYRLNFQNRDCRLIVCLDITEKETAISKLEEKGKMLQTAEKIAKLGYWGHNVNSNSLYWSDEVYNIWEEDSSTFKPDVDVFFKSVYPDDLEDFIKEQSVAITGEKNLDFEHRIILPNGTIKWIHEKGKLTKDKQGNNLRFEGTVQDITDRKIAEQKLLVSEARHRGILKSQTNYLIRTNLEGNYSYSNEKFNKDFSWIFLDNSIVGKSARSCVKGYHQQRIKNIFIECIKNPNNVYQVELDKLEQNGGVKSTLWDLIGISDSDGNTIEVQGVGVDITDRIKAERSLKESNTRYELVSKATSDAIWDWDIQTGNIFWSETFATQFGHCDSTLSPSLSGWLDHIHPDDKKRVTEDIYAVIDGKENNWTSQYRFKKANGSYAFVEDRGFIIRNKNNKAVRFVGAMQDLTERKKLEDLLDKATSLSKIGSYEFDLINNSLFWSPMTKKIHGVEQDFVPDLKKAILFFKKGANRTSIETAINKAIKDNVPFDLELKIITTAGDAKWVRTIGQPEFEDGKCICLSGSLQDIDKIKTTELEAIKVFEEKEMILDSIGDAFFAINKDYKVTYWNKQAEKLLRCPKNTIVGNNLWDIFSDAKNTAFEEYYEKAFVEKEKQHFEAFYERLSFWLEVTVYPLENGLSVYFKDITDRKEADLKLLELNKSLKEYTDELINANKGLEQFSYIISHNLRAPVANIRGLADLLSDEDYPNEVKENFIKEIIINIKRLDHIVTDLNDILHVKTELTATKEPVDLVRLVNSIQSGIENLIQQEKVQIVTNFIDVPVFDTIKSYLHSIFSNLIVNSIKYRQPGKIPIIEIKSQMVQGNLTITFKDNGMGIDLSKRKQQVFGLYKRFHHHVEGKGMGLFMVKTQVELLGGEISVVSEVNEGTEFIIEFKNYNSNLITEDESATSLYSR